MKFIQNLLDKARPAVTTGKLKPLYPLHNAIETLMFVPDHTTHSGAHIRDSIDLKRTMFTVIIALIPALLFGMWNIGHWHYIATGESASMGLMDNVIYGAMKLLPMIIVTYATGLGVEILFSYLRKHPVNEGFLVSGMLIPLIMPADMPLWMVGVSTIFAVLIGKEVFGGTGMNILNPALTARAFAFFAYPKSMSGDSAWISGLGGEGIVDGFSGATALSQFAAGNTAPEIAGHALNAQNAFLGIIPGSIGETSVLAILIGAAILIYTGIGSWKIMFSGVIGALFMGLVFNWVAPYAATPAVSDFMAISPVWHLLYGGFAFGIVFMATDPVSAAQTERGKWIYGFLTGFFCIAIRVFNPGFPEGVMLAILFMNVMAPLIDHYVVQANVKKRQKRAQLANANA